MPFACPERTPTMTTLSFRSCARLLFATLCALLLIAPLQAQLAPIPGRLLLRLSKGAEPVRIQRDLQAVLPAAWGDVQLKALGDGGRYHLLMVADATADAERMAALVQGLRGVEATQVDLPVQRRAQPNDPLYGDQWHLLDMNVEPVWNSTIGGATATGQRIAVGIVDSGVQGAHPDLADNIVLDLVAADEHGTAVAGVVGAVGNNGVGVSGVNWDVDLLSAATVNTLSDVFTQFQFCLNQRTLFNQSNGSQGRMIVAVTASWGFPGVGCGFGEPLFDDLGAAGILVVTAGPNDGTDIDVTPDYPSTCPNANNIVVTSYGPAGQVPYAVGDNTVHLLAPGVDIMTTGLGGTYGAVDGNSFAIPAVAGAVALLYSNDCVTFAQGITSDPQGTALQVKQAILNGVAPFPGGNAITITGGKLDVHGAYQQLAAQCAPCASVIVDLVTPAGTSAQYSVVNGLGSALVNGTGNAFTFCAADGCFTATVSDGNGPLNGTFTATLQGTVVASGAITNGAFGFTLGTPVQGCTNANAINYDPNAQCDDGSCCTEGLVQVSILTDEQGLSGTVELTVIQAGTVVHDGPLPVFDLPGLGVSGAQLTFCQPPGCLTVELGSSNVPLSTLSLIRTFDGQDLQEFFFVPSEGFSGAVGPAPPELCDGLDNDCDGAVDEDFLWYADADQDGWGDASTEALFCTPPTGAFTQQPGDCNDSNAAIFPGASDLCGEADGIDNDCNGLADDQEGTIWFADADNDGRGTDLDIVQACTQPPGYVANGGDCDDADASVNPGASEACDGVDNDCDGATDEDFLWYVDADGDGFGAAGSEAVLSCTQPPNTAAQAGDCDDARSSVFPGAAEVCDGLDNDCDGTADEDFFWFVDADADGFGDPATVQYSCTPMPGRITTGGDCDDANAAITTPGSACNDGDPNTIGDVVTADCQCQGFQQGGCPPGEVLDCNGNCAPADWVGDGFCDDGSFEWEGNFIDLSCAALTNDGGDCGAACTTEVCDGQDNDCDGLIDEDFFWYPDADGDGYGDQQAQVYSCTPIANFINTGGDCNDTDAAVNPGATEVCDGVDNNCDGFVDGTTAAFQSGCTDPLACNYDPNAVCPDGSCVQGSTTTGTERYATNFTATAVNGDPVDLFALLAQGKTVVLDLFTTWCPPSNLMNNAGFLQDWYAHMGPDGLDAIRIISVEIEDTATVAGSLAPYVATMDWPIINTGGGAIAQQYGALELYNGFVPTLVMICPDRSATMLYGGPDLLPYTGTFQYAPAAALELLNARCGCRGEPCLANIGCMDPNACNYDPSATCPGPCAQAQEWFADNDGDGVGGTSLGTACTPPANSVAVSGDCDDDNASVQQGFTLFVLTNDPGDFGTAHYVIQHGGGVLEGDLDLPQETEGIGELAVCIANGCYTISISQNDVLLWEEAYLEFPDQPGVQQPFATFDGYQGGGSAEVCDGVDNDCDGAVDEGCGNCSEADRAWILANEATIEGIITANLNNCLGSGDQLACFTAALVQGTPLPEACASCVAQRYVCIIGSCLAPCVGGFGSPACDACVNSTCNAAYFACAGFTDSDGDGVVAEQDCDDSNANVFPGANELCDTIDNDCDGLVDETPTTYFADNDGDGWGDENNPVQGGCSPPNGATSQGGDCDDSDPDIFPGAPELCNGIDDDCNGAVDDSAGLQYFVDADNDGFGASGSGIFSCTPIPGRITTGGDCNDTDLNIYPGAPDPCDNIDQDCSGGPFRTTWYQDSDGDGFGNDAVFTQDCTQPLGFVASGGDCDDADNTVFPGNGCSTCTLTEQAWLAANQQALLAAVNDCALQCSGDPTCIAACVQNSGVPLGAVCLSCIDGYLLCTQDNCSFACLNAPEFCFSCQVQAGCLATLATCMGQVDADGDGWWAGSDCDDSNANAFPGAAEVCDGVDNNCDGTTDEGISVTYYTDADGDGFGVDGTGITGTCTAPPGTATQGGDCDDANDTVFPGAPELCDGIDNNCDELIDNEAGTLYYTDADGDGYGDDATGQFSCTTIPGTVTVGGDCNDANAAINPGAADPCDAIDQDCSGGPVLSTWYQDNDADGFGNTSVSVSDCTQPVGFVAQGGDCDDTNNDLYPGNGCATCTATEQQWLAANQVTLLSALNNCAALCLTGTPECITSCLQDEGVPVGAICLTCVSDYFACTFSNCALACLGSDEACLECQLQSGCFATFAGCLGMVDADEDGWWAGIDCDDNNPSVHPGATEVCNGIDDDCDGTVDNNAGDAYYPDADGDGYGDTDALVLSCTPVPGLITQGGDCNDSDPAVNPLGTESCNGLDDDCDGTVDEDCVLLDLKVLLDGPYNPSTGLMNDGLRALGLVPTTEPYTALGYSYTGVSATTTSPVVLATTGPDAIVDWVVVELRAGTDPTVLVASRCALLQRDGDVVDLDGISPLSIAAVGAELYVALRHRNHLGVMTAVPFTLSNVPTTIDLRTGAEACFGADARRSVSGAFPATTLWTGDVDRNNVVRYTGPANDRDPLLQAIGGAVPTNTTAGYLPQDVNMDGVVRYVGAANDRDPILQTVGGSVPTNTRSGTLP